MASFDLNGRVAIVTGGNGGIGLGMARGLAEAGAAVVVAGRNAEKNAVAVAELEALGGKAIGVEVDVAKEASCQAMVSATTDAFGRRRRIIPFPDSHRAGHQAEHNALGYTFFDIFHVQNVL